MGDTQPNFDPIARPYRWLEYLTSGPFLERCRFYYLGRLSHNRRAVILGDGDGRFTAKLLVTNTQITVEAVDISAKMLQLLSQRAAQLRPSAANRLRTRQTDAQTLNLEGQAYDLVVTHFFLDCLTEEDLTSLLHRLTPHIAPGAAWLISEFAIPSSGPMKPLSQLIVASLYRAFRLLTGLRVRQLPNYTPLLQQAGLTLIERKLHLGGLLASELWRFDSQSQATA
jgi:ubiquinone/menaquinone biosynthesis C-methylase UbiE